MVTSPGDVCPMGSTGAVPPSPPLSVMSLSLKTVVNPKTHTHEVVVATILHHSAVSIDGPTTTRPGQVSHITTCTAPVRQAHTQLLGLGVE